MREAGINSKTWLLLKIHIFGCSQKFRIAKAKKPHTIAEDLLVVIRLTVPKQTKESAAATRANKRIGQKRRQKTVARLLCGHMFLLCGAGPYVSIGWLWAWGSAICFYY